MTNNMVQITAEILDFLATVTKEMKQSATSKSDLRIRFHDAGQDADIVSEKLLKRAMRQTNLEDGLKKLEELTSEGVAMASEQLLSVTDNIYYSGMGFVEKVKVAGKQCLSSESSASSLTSLS